MKIYIGNYIEVLTTLHEMTGVDLAVSEKRNVDDRMIDFCNEHNITFLLVESGEDLHKQLSDIESVDLCVVASFGLLLKKEFIQKVGSLVNIHPGSLINSRGRHPLPFAIKRGLPFMTLTAHLIEDEKIDKGPVIAEWNIPIDYSESYQDNDNRLRKLLPALTIYIVNQFDEQKKIKVTNLDLSKAPYNSRLSGDELQEMMQVKNLKRYNHL